MVTSETIGEFCKKSNRFAKCSPDVVPIFPRKMRTRSAANNFHNLFRIYCLTNLRHTHRHENRKGCKPFSQPFSVKLKDKDLVYAPAYAHIWLVIHKKWHDQNFAYNIAIQNEQRPQPFNPTSFLGPTWESWFLISGFPNQMKWNTIYCVSCEGNPILGIDFTINAFQLSL